jgi:hypothetical protein
MVVARGTGRLTGAEVQAARARRHAAEMAPLLDSIRAAGISTLRGMADELNRRGVPTSSGKGQRRQSQVLKVLRRLNSSAP